MKVNEILREQRLDEIAPLALAGMAISAVIAGLKVMSVVEIYNVLSKNGYDIDNMTEDEKIRLFVDFIIMFVPGGGRFTNEVIMRILPDAVKRRGAKMVGDKLTPMAHELRKMKNANRKKYADKPGTSAAQSAKNQKSLTKANKKLDSQYSAVGKQLAAEKLKDGAYNIIGGIAVLPLAYLYYGKLDELDTQYQAHKGGDTTTAIFGQMTADAAFAEYNKLRNKYIGELTIGVTSALSRSPVAKLAEAFTKIVGKTPLVGGLIKLPLVLATRVAKVGGPALAIMMQTEQGQKFLSNTVVEFITRGVGAITNATVNLLTSALDAALGAAGIDSNLNKFTKGQDPSPEVGKAASGEAGRASRLAITSDPKNPNIKYISGQQVTDADGFLKNNIPNVLRNIGDTASGLGIPNPVQQLKKNPSLSYPAY